MLDRRAAEELAAALDLEEVRRTSCPACLVGVACALDGGDEAEVRKAVRAFAPLLWDEGLGEALAASLARARERGASGADAAIEDLEARGARSKIVDAVVRRLAGEQVREMERRRVAYLN